MQPESARQLSGLLMFHALHLRFALRHSPQPRTGKNFDDVREYRMVIVTGHDMADVQIDILSYTAMISRDLCPFNFLLALPGNFIARHTYIVPTSCLCFHIQQSSFPTPDPVSMARQLIWSLVLIQCLPNVLNTAVAQDDTTMNTSTAQPTVGWYTAPNERSTLSLVYSCLITTFACTWTVLHLNVPAIRDSGWTRFKRKAKWMAITVLLPEFIFAKAVCELRLALQTMVGLDKKIRHEYDNDLSCVTEFEYGEKIKWTWRVKYGRVVRLLLYLFRLRRPDNLAQRPAIEEKDMSHINARKEEADHASLSFVGGDTVRQIDEQPQTHSGTGVTNGDAAGQDYANSSRTESQKVGSMPSDSFILESQYWTLAHSYFANMGGLVYQKLPYWVPVNHSVLTGPYLHGISWPPGAHPLQGLILTQEDIADKSKADWVLRAMSIMQITWLMLTIFARHASALPLTQLELATFAFSIFAVATYSVNWWKPKDVSRPTHLSGVHRFSIDLDQTQSFVLRLMSPGKANAISASSIAHAARVKNDVVDLEGRLPLIFKLMAAAAFVFGGIHCLAWNFAFSSHAEAILWRVASIGSAVIPIIQLGISILFNHLSIIAENSILLFLVKELDQLKEFPLCYFDHLGHPDLAESVEDNNISCTTPTGACTFFHGVNQQELRGIERGEFYAEIKTEMAMETADLLSEFFRIWKNVPSGETSFYDARASRFARVFRKLQPLYNESLEAFFVHYENIHIKPIVTS